MVKMGLNGELRTVARLSAGEVRALHAVSETEGPRALFSNEEVFLLTATLNLDPFAEPDDLPECPGFRAFLVAYSAIHESIVERVWSVNVPGLC